VDAINYIKDLLDTLRVKYNYI